MRHKLCRALTVLCAVMLLASAVALPVWAAVISDGVTLVNTFDVSEAGGDTSSPQEETTTKPAVIPSDRIPVTGGRVLSVAMLFASAGISAFVIFYTRKKERGEKHNK